jgi:hypothetical protein
MLTPAEAVVLDFCARRPVVTLAQLRSGLRLAPITIRRALKSLGYFSSFNHNARYYTLANKPRFAANGLWFYRSIGFSRHRTLTSTLVALVHDAPAGATPEELTHLLRTPVGNLLASLARQQQLARRRLGRQVVYLACERQRQEQQWTDRQKDSAPSATGSALPADVEATTVLALLAELIRSPQASIDQLARTLRRRGVPVDPPCVQAILVFYQLEKKRGTLKVAEILQDVRNAGVEQLRQLGSLPAEAVYTFDRPAEECQAGQALPPMIKTRRRVVVSLRFGAIRCREVLRQADRAGRPSPSGLDRFVATGMR